MINQDSKHLTAANPSSVGADANSAVASKNQTANRTDVKPSKEDSRAQA